MFKEGKLIAYNPDLDITFPVEESDESSLSFSAQPYFQQALQYRPDLITSSHMGYAVVAMKAKKYARIHRIPIDDILDIKDVLITFTKEST